MNEIEVDSDSADVRRAEREAKRLVDRARGREPAVHPVPWILSWVTFRDVFTLDGRFPFVRFDEEGNPQPGPATHTLLIVSAFVVAAGLALIVSLL